jgi:short-subunit dehydrogenase
MHPNTSRIPAVTGASRGIGAAAMVWPLSNEASHITGALLDISGGR